MKSNWRKNCSSVAQRKESERGVNKVVNQYTIKPILYMPIHLLKLKSVT